MKSENSPAMVRWGVTDSEATFNDKKDSEDTLKLSVEFVNSKENKDLNTAFYLADGTWLRTIIGSGGSRWGQNGAHPLGGNPFEQPLPERLKLTYYSRVDDKFYQLDTLLPMDKIRPLFTNTKKSTNEEPSVDAPYVSQPLFYRNIQIATAPEGWVILFAIGNFGQRRELGSWQATEIDARYGTDVLRAENTGFGPYNNDEDEKKVRQEFRQEFFIDELRDRSPKMYERWQSGDWKISADWYKRMQTKYPWRFAVTIDEHEWNGEYYAQFANTEAYDVVDEQIEKEKTVLKAVPNTFTTWVADKETGQRHYIEVHFFPRPKWDASQYQPYYQDPNLDYLSKRFEHLYPKRSYMTNDEPVDPNEFATVKLHFNKDLILQEAYLQKGEEKILLDSTYQYYLSPVAKDATYQYTDGYPHFLTTPKIQNLSDPDFVDLD
ncbi:DUF2931 family protein [Psychrobacter sp. AOP7-D1-15]|uniref:DUF2931 family protein n=1 Tax=unclassified Psychrobacter TaxID=196806 RepID=UPI0018694084|nr:DUF2931 family protein [Psychrobacter sp. FME61]